MLRFPKESLAARATRLSPDFTVVRPEADVFGNGPYPTTIMMHGCGDQFGPQPEYAKAAAKHGVASIIVDSYTSRQITKVEAAGLVCAGLRLWGRERAGDVMAALHWARGQSFVDADRLSRQYYRLKRYRLKRRQFGLPGLSVVWSGCANTVARLDQANTRFHAFG
jgi:hypothetical protein